MKKKRFEDFFLWKGLIWVERTFLWVISILIVLVITATVIMRYILKTDLYGMEELLILLAMWLYFVGGSYGSYENSHITADILSAFVKNEKIIKAVKLFIAIVSFVVALFFTRWAFTYWKLVMRLGGRTSGLHYPLWMPRLALIVGFVLIDIFSLYNLVCLLIGRKPVIVGMEEELLVETQTEEMI